MNNKSTNKIPKGQYCYTNLKVNKEGDEFEIEGLCPFFKKKRGYCSFLKKEIEKPSNKDKESLGLSLNLLWCLCKECGINE